MRNSVLIIFFYDLTIVFLSKQFRINRIFSNYFPVFIESDEVSLSLSVLINFFIQLLFENSLAWESNGDRINLDYFTFKLNLRYSSSFYFLQNVYITLVSISLSTKVSGNFISFVVHGQDWELPLFVLIYEIFSNNSTKLITKIPLHQLLSENWTLFIMCYYLQLLPTIFIN